MAKARGPNYNLPKSRNKFTNEDDVALIKGILKYGVSWAKIYHDEEFPFVNGIRDSTLALRDRCRNRFPVVYKYLYDHQVDDQQKVEYLHHMRMALTAANWDLEAHSDTSVYTTRSGAKMMNMQNNFKRFSDAPVKNDVSADNSQHNSTASSPKSAAAAAAAAAAASTANQTDSENQIDMNAQYYAYPMDYYSQFSHEQLMAQPEHTDQNGHPAEGTEESSAAHNHLQAMIRGMAGAPEYQHTAIAAAAAVAQQQHSHAAAAAAVAAVQSEVSGNAESTAPPEAVTASATSIQATGAVVSSETISAPNSKIEVTGIETVKIDKKIDDNAKSTDEENAPRRFESIGGLAGVATAALELEQMENNEKMVTPQEENAQFTFARKKGAAVPASNLVAGDVETKKRGRRPMVPAKKI